MMKSYYSYSFNLDDGLIQEEILEDGVMSPLKAVGCELPIHFDDYVDIWKSMCYPIFENQDDEQRLTLHYFQIAYQRGERSLAIHLEHNPLKNTYAAKYTCVNVRMFEDETSRQPRALVLWGDSPELECRKARK